MIKVDLHNYEAFALDYVEGRLVGDDLSAFELFLVNHPEIKIEIDSLTIDLIGFDNNDKFNYKTDLKKEALLSENINEDNYKTYFIAYHEGDLSDQTKDKVNFFLSQHADKSKEFETFAALKYASDQSVYFPLKRQLKKATPVFGLYIGLRVAASIAIFLGIGWYFSQSNTEEQQYTQRSKIIEEKESLEVESNQIIENTASNLINQLKDDTIVLSNKSIQAKKNHVEKENQTEKQIFEKRDELLSISSATIQNTTINQQFNLNLKTKTNQDHMEIAVEDDNVFKIKLPKLFKKSNKEKSKNESSSIASAKFEIKKKKNNPDQKTYVDLGPFKVYKKKGVTADLSNLNESKEGL